MPSARKVSFCKDFRAEGHVAEGEQTNREFAIPQRGENPPGSAAASKVFAPALEGGNAAERGNRIYERNVDRKLEWIEKSQGSSGRLREEQQMRRDFGK